MARAVLTAGDLHLELPAIKRFHFESWTAFWYWWTKAENGFKYIQMSD